MPLAGAPSTLCQEPQEASQRHLWELVSWRRDSGGQRDAVRTQRATRDQHGSGRERKALVWLRG